MCLGNEKMSAFRYWWHKRRLAANSVWKEGIGPVGMIRVLDFSLSAVGNCWRLLNRICHDLICPVEKPVRSLLHWSRQQKRLVWVRGGAVEIEKNGWVRDIFWKQTWQELLMYCWIGVWVKEKSGMILYFVAYWLSECVVISRDGKQTGRLWILLCVYHSIYTCVYVHSFYMCLCIHIYVCIYTIWTVCAYLYVLTCLLSITIEQFLLLLILHCCQHWALFVKRLYLIDERNIFFCFYLCIYDFQWG